MQSPTALSTGVLLLLLLLVLGGCTSVGHALQQDASASRHAMQEAAQGQPRPNTTVTYCMPDGDDEEMANARAVLRLWGYEETEDPLQATLLWYTGHPFRGFCPYLTKEQQAQLLQRLRQDPAPAHPVVNSHPGIRAITDKKQLAALSATLPFLPRTFRLPAEYAAWQAFMDSEEGAGTQWMQKGLGHGGVQFLPDPKSPEHAHAHMLVQQRIKPFLVHKRLWDIGLFVSITCVDPLVAYVHTGAALLRFTPQEYDPSLTRDTDRQTFVVANEALQFETIGSTQQPPNGTRGTPQLPGTLAGCLDMLRSQGVNTTGLLLQAYSHFVQLLQSANGAMREAQSSFPATRTNGFMWARLDFMLDEDQQLHLIEANRSPGMTTRGFPDDHELNRRSVIHDILTLNGLNPGGLHHPGASADLQRLVADPVLLDVEEPACAGTCRDDCTSSSRCVLCHACRDERQNRILQRLQAEASGAHHFRRVYPPSQHLATYMQRHGIHEGSPDLESRPDNVLVATWLQAKCGLEPRFC